MRKELAYRVQGHPTPAFVMVDVLGIETTDALDYIGCYNPDTMRCCGAGSITINSGETPTAFFTASGFDPQQKISLFYYDHQADTFYRLTAHEYDYNLNGEWHDASHIVYQPGMGWRISYLEIGEEITLAIDEELTASHINITCPLIDDGNDPWFPGDKNPIQMEVVQANVKNTGFAVLQGNGKIFKSPADENRLMYTVHPDDLETTVIIEASGQDIFTNEPVSDEIQIDVLKSENTDQDPHYTDQYLKVYTYQGDLYIKPLFNRVSYSFTEGITKSGQLNPGDHKIISGHLLKKLLQKAKTSKISGTYTMYDYATGNWGAPVDFSFEIPNIIHNLPEHVVLYSDETIELHTLGDEVLGYGKISPGVILASFESGNHKSGWKQILDGNHLFDYSQVRKNGLTLLKTAHNAMGAWTITPVNSIVVEPQEPPTGIPVVEPKVNISEPLRLAGNDYVQIGIMDHNLAAVNTTGHPAVILVKNQKGNTIIGTAVRSGDVVFLINSQKNQGKNISIEWRVPKHDLAETFHIKMPFHA